MALNKKEQRELAKIQKSITDSVKDRGAAVEKEARNHNKILDAMKNTSGQVMDMAKSLKKIAGLEENLDKKIINDNYIPS